jgi:hypothetical protein
MQRQGSKSVAKPVALGEKQRVRFAVQWILEASEGKMGKTVEERLAREIVAVVQGTSQALKKKEETHRFAMVNRWVSLGYSALCFAYLHAEATRDRAYEIIYSMDHFLIAR